jgi:23S rRNA (guanosine2251-2'-O)-methyltransferase
MKNNTHKSGKKPYKQSAKRRAAPQERSEHPERTYKKKHSAAPDQPKLARAALFGFHAVREAWLNPAREIQALYATDQGAESFKEALESANRAKLSRPRLMIIDKKHLESLLPEGAVHQGLGLVCANLPEVDVQDLIIRYADQSDSLLVILDQVTDPHNIGAILRSACAFGAHGLIMQRKHAPEITGTLAKTACGALEHVPLAYETNLSRTIEQLQEAGYFVYGLDERGTTNIDKIKPGGKSALVLGAEGPGIRHLIKEHCDALVRLPMDGPMPSINVSNAAAVALYALSKPRA